MPTIRLAHSPDSDDAFMFYALAAGKIDTGGRRYEHELQDIETLNQRALEGELDVTAVSIHAYAYLAERYALLSHGASMGDRYGPRLSHGASMGDRYGPRLVAKAPPPPDPRAGIRGKRVAIPGRLTTAALALRLYQPDFEAAVVPFDRIEDAVLQGEVDAGLLIHEGQLTYSQGGLNLWADMGEWWHGETGLPLPLGGNAVRRDLGDELIGQISRDLKASIVYGLEHREEALSQAADEFVGMYVNEYTVDYGEAGRRAVQLLLERAAHAGIIPSRVPLSFVE
jgi:1,4-dihydroxy-6-naphthoate synthase